MRQLGFLGLATLTLLAGCGMEAVDNRMQARSESGINQYPLEVVEGEYVCPHVVSINNQAFDVKAVISGSVDDHFGPFVPCLTPVAGGPGSTGTCDNCQNQYKVPTGDEDPDAEPDGASPPMAVPKMKCPHQAQHGNESQFIDPTAVFVKGSKDSLLGYSNCPSCKRYFTIKETDLLAAIDVHEEVHCPECKRPIDPTLNQCANKSCKLGGVVRNVQDFEGPCWRCGGVGICPNCKLSGQGNLGMYGSSPSECWTCGTSGRCPECSGEGFSTYEGTLPKAYTAWGREQALPSKSRKWKHSHDDAGAGGGSSEDLGQPEDEDGDGG